MCSIKSSFKFKDYTVDKISLEKNPKFTEEFQDEIKEISEIMDFDCVIKEIKEFEKYVTLVVNIGNTDKLPYKLHLELTGNFEYSLGEQHLEPDEIEKLFKRNAVTILFPYVRALVSSYTSISNVSPLMIPAINIIKLLEEKEKSKRLS